MKILILSVYDDFCNSNAATVVDNIVSPLPQYEADELNNYYLFDKKQFITLVFSKGYDRLIVCDSGDIAWYDKN